MSSISPILTPANPSIHKLNHPTGGRNKFSQRVQACFSTLNITAPNDQQLKRIFGTILNAKLSELDEEVGNTSIFMPVTIEQLMKSADTNWALMKSAQCTVQIEECRNCV